MSDAKTISQDLYDILAEQSWVIEAAERLGIAPREAARRVWANVDAPAIRAAHPSNDELRYHILVAVRDAARALA